MLVPIPVLGLDLTLRTLLARTTGRPRDPGLLTKMRFLRHPLICPDAVEDREYQRRIAGAAGGRNTLVVLPTALGKTVISALVAADYLLSQRRGRVLVMAPTRPLISQHRRSLQRLIRLP